MSDTDADPDDEDDRPPGGDVPAGESTADVFDTLRRFHIYDYNAAEWLMSGVDFGPKGIVIDHQYNGAIDAYDDPRVITHGRDELLFVWEDDPEAGAETSDMDEEVALNVFEAARQDIARQEGIDPATVRVLGIDAPGTVRYVTL